LTASYGLSGSELINVKNPVLALKKPKFLRRFVKVKVPYV
jgi:hypothetical protein